MSGVVAYDLSRYTKSNFRPRSDTLCCHGNFMSLRLNQKMFRLLPLASN